MTGVEVSAMSDLRLNDAKDAVDADMMVKGELVDSSTAIPKCSTGTSPPLG
jgi:hypothetical protein